MSIDPRLGFRASEIARADQSAPGQVRFGHVALVLVGGGLLGIVLTATAAIVLQNLLIRGPGDEFYFALHPLQRNFYYNNALLMLSMLPQLGLILFLTRRPATLSLTDYFPRVPLRTIGLAAMVGVGVAALTVSAEYLATRAFGLDFETGIDFLRSITPATPMQLVLTLLIVAGLAPFIEELCFRGLLLRWLRRHVGTAAAVIGSAAVFALLHGYMLLRPDVVGWIFTGEIAIGGVVMALFAVKTGSLWPSLVVHAAWNAAAIIASMVQGP